MEAYLNITIDKTINHKEDNNINDRLLELEEIRKNKEGYVKCSCGVHLHKYSMKKHLRNRTHEVNLKLQDLGYELSTKGRQKFIFDKFIEENPKYMKEYYEKKIKSRRKTK